MTQLKRKLARAGDGLFLPILRKGLGFSLSPQRKGNLPAFSLLFSEQREARRYERYFRLTLAMGMLAGTALAAGSVHAQQPVNAGTGDDINVNGRTAAGTATVPGLYAHDGGRIYNTPGPGNEVTISSAFNADVVRATAGSVINLDGGGTVTSTFAGPTPSGGSGVGLHAVGGTITSSVDVTTISGSSNPSYWGFAGVLADTGGTITLNGGTIKTSGDVSYGVAAVSTGGKSTVTGFADIITTGKDGLGAHANGAGTTDGATVTLTGGSVTTSGNEWASGIGAAGLSAIGNGTINADAVTVLTSGIGSVGLGLSGVATSNLNGTSITTKGVRAHGISLGNWAGGGTRTVTGTSVTISTQGTASHGIYAGGVSPNTVTLDATSTITTSGDGAAGVWTEAAGTLNLNGGTISTSGQASHGLYSSGGFTNLTAMGVNVAVSGAGAAGVLIQDASGLTLSNSQVSSAQSNALLSTAATGLTNTAQITRSVLSSASDTAMVFQGGTQNFSLQLSQVSSGNGTLLRVDYGQPGGVVDLTNPAHLTLSVAASNLPGDMVVVDPGTNTADVTLSDGTTWTGASHGVSNLTVDGSRWTVTGDSTFTGTLTNGGMVAFASGGAFKTITMQNYVGNGGTMSFNTALGGNASPTDRLVIDGGTATGTTGVTVTNAGGAGGLTSGLGIPVVVATNGGTTAAGAFSLAGTVAAGAYEYLLFHGNTASPTATAEQVQGWYLRSHLLPSPPPCTNPDGCGPGPSPTPQPIPLYRPEAPVYAAAAGAARGLGMTLLGTFHERAGDQSLLRGSGPVPGAWGRWIGQKTETAYGGPLSPKFDGTTTGLQAGLDLYGFEQPGYGQDRFGVFFGYARSLGDIKGFALGQQGYKAGKMDLSGYSIGGTWTHVGPGGWYVDAVLMGTRYDGDPRSNRGQSAKVKGYGVTASLESGLPLALGRGFVLEPQAQIVWQHLKLDDSYDRFATIAFDTPDTVAGRFGLRLSGAFQAGGAVLKPYVTANVWQDFAGSDKTIFSGTALRSGGGNATSAELTGGIASQITQSVGLWGDVSYLTDIAGPDRQAWRGNVGVRVTW